MVVYFGGLDLAKRVDHSALVVLKLDEGILYEYAEKLWQHVDYSQVGEDIYKYHQKLKFNRIGFDRTGVGDAAMELFKPKNIFEPIIQSNPKKVELISLFQSLMLNGKLKITVGGELEKQIKEQEWDKTDAGNLIYRHPTRSHDDLFWALTYACYVGYAATQGTVKTIMKVGEPDYRSLDNMIDDEIEIGLNVV